MKRERKKYIAYDPLKQKEIEKMVDFLRSSGMSESNIELLGEYKKLYRSKSKVLPDSLEINGKKVSK